MTAALLATSIGLFGAETAFAQQTSDGPRLTPIVEARLRYENVDQPSSEGEALTARIRAGVMATQSDLTFLVEGEGTLALDDSYNAFPFPIDDEQRRPQFSVIADPQNLELNRLQLSWFRNGQLVTIGRQRINLDDQRWVGSVGWRQNEQTFDAVRGEFTLGEVKADLTYSISQRTIFGADADMRAGYDGNFLFGGAGGKLGTFNVKTFAYLLDYDEDFVLANSSQTYGLLLDGAVPLGEEIKLALKASYARQSDFGDSTLDYGADYLAVEAGAKFSIANFSLGFEQLGSDNGAAVQTPMATLHKFNGWADMFLSTPANGLEDRYAGLALDLGRWVKSMNAQIVYHDFSSDIGDLDYGHEWNASLGGKLGKIGLLAKYARYEADTHAVDTEKFWLQAEYKF